MLKRKILIKIIGFKMSGIVIVFFGVIVCFFDDVLFYNVNKFYI